VTDTTFFEINTQMMRKGDIKTIHYGPWSGLECEVLEINNTNKIVVRSDSLQQQLIATLPSYYLQEQPLFA
jgi:transcriptional antiterminator RfaH